MAGRQLAMRRAARGFTLVEITVVLALAALLATLAWPTLREPLLRARRADAVAALTRIQLAQESYRAQHGLYATGLDALRGVSAARSPGGLYDLELHAGGAEQYAVRALPRAGSAVDGDAGCPVISLVVDAGRAQHAPDARCWNR